MRPGKATMFGVLGGLPVLSLPGNAVAALVNALVFLKPTLSALAGLGFDEVPRDCAVLAAPLSAVGPRDTFLRGRLDRGADGRPTFTAMAMQDTAMLLGLAKAHALTIRPANAPPAQPGEMIEVIRFDR
ncbi:molybdopterin molybdenumtransferase MoeA, partial [Methylobacterium planeticum]